MKRILATLLLAGCGGQPPASAPVVYGPVLAEARGRLPSPPDVLRGSTDPELLEEVRGLLEAAGPMRLTRLGRSALGSLTADRDRHRPSVLAVLAIPDIGVEPRRGALRFLEEETDQALIPYLVLRMKYETNEDLSVSTADLLGRLGSRAGQPGLDEVVRRGGSAARAAAAALAALPTSSLPDTPALRAAIWQQVAALASPQLRHVDDARFVLARLAPLSTEILGEALLDENRYVRAHSVEVLHRQGPSAATARDRVRLLLADPAHRAGAVRVLARIADPLDAGLIEEAKSDPDPEVRAAAGG